MFGFELTVVMIGVLAAQQISNWAQRQSNRGHAEDVRTDLLHSFGIYKAIARDDLVAIPCIDARVALVLRLAGGHRALDPAILSTAFLAEMGPDTITPADEQLLRERFGDKVTNQITSVEFNLGLADQAFRDLDRKWLEFGRADARYGSPNDADFAAVRAAAIQMKGDLALLGNSLGSIDRLTSELGVTVAPDSGFKPISSCDQMWRIGKGYIGH